jgi:hypothetical protein
MGIDNLRFLFGEPRFVNSLDPEKTDAKTFDIEEKGLQLNNRLEQKRVARDCAKWISDKVEIRSVKQANLLHGKMYHIENNGVEDAILGSSNFTVAGLGLGERYNNIELNLEVDSRRDRQDLRKWFDEIWSNTDLVEDVREEVLHYLEKLYTNNSPELIYFKTLYHLFECFLEEQETDRLLEKTNLIIDSQVWNALFDFQKDGVKAAINKILNYNGCIIADSVGLGKTYEAEHLRQGEHVQHQVALCDGCQALQSRMRAQFPGFVLVLDFIHAEEYLWQVANGLLGETNDQRFQWMAQHTLQMLSGDTEKLIRDFRQLAQQPQTTPAQRQQLHRTANYFERNLPYMDYPTCLANGWPIASGVIEGACRHFVKDRCELSGMRWHQSGVENLLRLRAVAENDDWEAYHAFRRRQRHRRLYGSPIPNTQPIEIQVIPSPSPSHDPIPSTHPPNYHQLPLAA